MQLDRRQVLAGAGASLALTATPAAAQAQFGPPELMEAARKEGKVVYYTADFLETEQEVIKEFNKRFPFVRVELVRAPGGQLITRIRTEAAANKLFADVVNHSDRGLMIGIEDLFRDYAPPNAKDYREDFLVSPKLWPRAALGWAISYNTELVKNPPKSWMDLTKPEYGNKQIGQVVGPSGGTTWTRVMFEREVLGEDYHTKQAATKPALYPSGAPTSDAVVRGEVAIAPLLYNIIYVKKRDGAPVEIFFPPEGVPVNPYAAGITRASANPNAARLFLNWLLSEEAQSFMIRQQGNLTGLRKPPVNPPGFDPEKVKLWVPNFERYSKNRDAWIEDWNKTYSYRQ